jgi:hypothetical protein
VPHPCSGIGFDGDPGVVLFGAERLVVWLGYVVQRVTCRKRHPPYPPRERRVCRVALRLIRSGSDGFLGWLGPVGLGAPGTGTGAG